MKENTYFLTIAFLIFSHLQNFLKIGKKFTDQKQKYWRMKLEKKVTVD